MTDRTTPEALNSYFDRASIALALAAADGDNPLVRVNKGFCDLTGYSPEDVIGHNCRMLQRDAENPHARDQIHLFLEDDHETNVRVQLVNFRKAGAPFINLLYMSKLRDPDGKVRFIFASQFDVSRAQPDMLAAYDAELARTLDRITPALAESGVVVEGSLLTIANTAATIAQAKLTLHDLDDAAL